MTELGDRLNELAQDLTAGVELAAPGRRRLPRQRSHRRAALSITVAAVAAVAVIALLVAQNRHARVEVSTQPSTTPASGAGNAGSTPYQPSTDMVVINHDRLRIVNADTGTTVRSVEVHGSTNVDSALTISPGGDIVYTGLRPYLCRNSSIVTINTTTGQETTVLRHAVNPALSPNGQFLAYTATVPYPSGFDDPQGCATGRTYVRDLRSGQVRSWNITTTPVKDRPPQLITGLTWAANSRQLIVTSTGGDLPPSLTQILDTTTPPSATNPLSVGGKTAYATPILLPDGTLIGIVEPCPNNSSCGGMPISQTGSTIINTIRPATGTIISTFHTPQDVLALLLDPSGQRLEAITGTQPDTFVFQHLHGRHLTPIFTTTTQTSYGWIPRPQ